MGEQHTPGPWFWALDRRGQHTSLMRSGSGDYVICPQADVGDYGLSVDPWNDVSEADAQLIAAAPELLEALKEAEKWAGEFNCPPHVWPSIRAAIAKATTPAQRAQDKGEG